MCSCKWITVRRVNEARFKRKAPSFGKVADWLIGCGSEAQQSKLARLETLTGGVPIGARVPRPVMTFGLMSLK